MLLLIEILKVVPPIADVTAVPFTNGTITPPKLRVSFTPSANPVTLMVKDSMSTPELLGSIPLALMVATLVSPPLIDVALKLPSLAPPLAFEGSRLRLGGIFAASRT